METVKITTNNAISVVEMNRPDALNAFSAQLMDELCDAFIEAAADDTVKVLVLTGAGRAFSAGADLKQMGQAGDYKSRHGLGGLLEAIIDFPKPFICAVNGLGIGIGATICGLADLVYMSAEARVRCPFSALGLTAEACSTVTFPQLMGRQRANWFLLSSEWMDAEQCLQAGFCLEVLPAAELMPRVMQQAQVLARLPIASLRKTKALMVDPVRSHMKAAVKAEMAGLAELAGGPANREALMAFAGKREPDFTGL